MLVNGNEEVLVVRAEPLELAEEISLRMVEVERLEDGAFLLDVDPAWVGVIIAVLVNKGVRVSELRCAQVDHSSPANSLKPRCPHMRTRK